MKSQEYWRQKIQQSITTQNANIDVEFGTVFDAVINPSAIMLEEISSEIDKFNRLIDFSKWEQWTDSEMQQIAMNYGLYRGTGTKSTGVITFHIIDKPTTDFIVPMNTTVSTTGGIKFRTTSRIHITNPQDFKNVLLGRYEFQTSIEALETGTEGNVPAGSIVISNVINKTKTVGGTDKESNEHFFKRILMLIQGGVGGTTNNGLRLRLLANFPDKIRSVEVETDNPIITGTTDIWFIGSRLKENTITTYWFNNDIAISTTPIVDIISIQSAGVQFHENIDWILIKDSISGFARTSKTRDVIRWISNSKPSFGSQIIINYISNDLVRDIENWVNKDYNKAIGLNLQYREGIPIEVEIKVTVHLSSGFGVEAYEQVKLNISNFVNSRGLGEPLEIADLISNVKKVPGVDNIIFNHLFKKGGEIGVSDLTTNKSGYFVVHFINLIGG